jgi:hypothetical protein
MSMDAPLPLVEDGETGDRFLVYRAGDDVRAELRVVGDSFWATQAQMAAMFDIDVSVVSRHIANVFAEGELTEATNLHKVQISRGQPTTFYSLNVLIAVGYRVSGPLGTMFRIWATERLFQYLTKGWVIDERRLKNPDGRPDHFDELLEAIRDIRSSEKRMWTRILELAAFCVDYDPQNRTQHVQFFAEIQNTMHWAVSQKTAAEIVIDEVSADKPYAGVLHFSGKQPTVDEAATAKNLLGEPQIKALNNITSLLLEFFESQAEQRRPTTLAAFLERMRELVKLDGRPLKPKGHFGTASAEQAKKHASEQIRIWKQRQKALREEEGDVALRKLAASTKRRPSND